MNPGLGQDEPELGIFVGAVAFQMLSHGHGFFDEEVQIFWDFRCQPLSFEDSQHFASGDAVDLCDTMRITQHHTDLGRCQSFLGQLADLFHHLRSRRGYRRQLGFLSFGLASSSDACCCVVFRSISQKGVRGSFLLLDIFPSLFFFFFHFFSFVCSSLALVRSSAPLAAWFSTSWVRISCRARHVR